MRAWLAILACILLLWPLPGSAQEALNTSGLPLPRFVSLKSEETNVRTGPGERYPISWIYKRARLPVQVIEEFGHWRKIRDYEGSEGWILKTLLDGRRTVLVTTKDTAVLRRSPEADAGPLARVQPMVIGKLLACSSQWCKVQVESYKGWLPKEQLWGILPREEFE